jgi:hypothetical protein
MDTMSADFDCDREGHLEPNGTNHGDWINNFSALMRCLVSMGGGTMSAFTPEIQRLVALYDGPLRRRKRCHCVLNEQEHFCRHCDRGNAGYRECNLMGQMLFCKIVNAVGADAVLREANKLD